MHFGNTTTIFWVKNRDAVMTTFKKCTFKLISTTILRLANSFDFALHLTFKTAVKMFPMMAKIAKLHTSLTLSMKFPKEGNVDIRNRVGYTLKFILLAPVKTRIMQMVIPIQIQVEEEQATSLYLFYECILKIDMHKH